MDRGIFLFIIIVLIPLVVGILLLRMFTLGDAGFYRLAGCLTFKPLVTLPLLLWIADLLSDAPRLLKASASVQPDIVITLLLMYRYRRLFAGRQARQAWGWCWWTVCGGAMRCWRCCTRSPASSHSFSWSPSSCLLFTQ
jgi:hypothetical protein